MKTWKRILRIAGLAGGLMLAGCGAVEHVGSAVLPGAPGPTGPAEVMVYPSEKPAGQPLDIEVIRVDQRTIRFENRTTTAYTHVTVYLNHDYGAVLDSIPIGTSPKIALARFTNEYAEPYPTGTFLTPEKSQPVVLATLIGDDAAHNLLVRLEEDWRLP